MTDAQAVDLVDRVRRGDRSAIGAAREAGPDAVPGLRALVVARDADDEVREVALYCLGQLPGTDAVRAMVPGLLDASVLVRAAAKVGLEGRADPGAYDDLLVAYDRSRVGYIRQRVALMLGALGERADVASLRGRYESEEDPEAREGGLVALARLGDPAARRAFVAALREAEGASLRRYLDHCRYLHAPWLLPALRELLADPTPVMFFSRHLPDDPGPFFVRAQDLAVGLVAAIADARFSFALAPRAQYTPAQLAEVRDYLAPRA